MLLSIHPDNPQERNIKTVIECLNDGGVIIYPTDTIYGIGCDIYKTEAIERICKIKGIATKHAQLSFICRDLSHLSLYAKNISTPIFRMLKNSLPGPYTYILSATKEVPKLLKMKKATVGIRVPDHKICQAILAKLDHPIISSSLPNNDQEDISYYTDPEVIYSVFGNQVDIVIDAGIGSTESSTVIDCSNGTPEIIRQGVGSVEHILI